MNIFLQILIFHLPWQLHHSHDDIISPLIHFDKLHIV